MMTKLLSGALHPVLVVVIKKKKIDHGHRQTSGAKKLCEPPQAK